ncbi:MAG: phosphoesterase [Ferrovum sp. 34-44-207]|nr:MAG: phosphoesterase [Ferrovum sp. 21-44-67]OZB31711.1 MAG: phosphoesterase [Ferrovum sp. 34-44-207]HQU07034.1 alkaline phosphatase family protein [Ferrovaceae bacterium]
MRNIAWLLFVITLPVVASTNTNTPIKHVIIVVGENRTFDQLYATWKPLTGQTVNNLLSQGIIQEDGSPGQHFELARQHIAKLEGDYSPLPMITGNYPFLPQPFATGAFGQEQRVPDQRFPVDLPNGPFQLSKYVSYGAHTGDPVHRFFQMWQQVNGGKNDLFVWVANTVGIGSKNGPYSTQPNHTNQGAVSMGFYNMATGDAPYINDLSKEFAISDNYHQPVMGGTTVNYFFLATADVGVFNSTDGSRSPPNELIENPNIVKGTNNFYINDGYVGGSYVNCADIDAPGVAGIKDMLKKLPYSAFKGGNCEKNRFYMVNNLDPAYKPNGTNASDNKTSHLPLLPPQVMPHIGDLLTQYNVSWKWYSGGRNDGVNVDKEYCGMCDVPTFFKSTMTGPDIKKLQDLQQFYKDVSDEKNFPAVSFIAPYDSVSGHPGYAMEPGFEELVKDVVTRVKSNEKLWDNTVIFVTTDEGGGYYDSGYIQFIDFFGDGPRIPLIAISPYTKKGYVDHSYADHASLLKFIEYNWSLPTLSSRSRDNLPNPVQDKTHTYMPKNRPAISDLTSLFDFEEKQH